MLVSCKLDIINLKLHNIKSNIFNLKKFKINFNLHSVAIRLQIIASLFYLFLKLIKVNLILFFFF